MARARRPPGSAQAPSEGAQTVVGRLASAYRLGHFGALPEGEEARFYRPRLYTVEEVKRAIIGEGLATPASAGQRISERYICLVIHRVTGQVLARIPRIVEYTEGTARSTRYSRARRSAQREAPRYVAGEDIDPSLLRMTCQYIAGSRFEIPMASPTTP